MLAMLAGIACVKHESHHAMLFLDEIGCETGEITAKEIEEKSGAKLNCHRFLATGETELYLLHE